MKGHRFVVISAPYEAGDDHAGVCWVVRKRWMRPDWKRKVEIVIPGRLMTLRITGREVDILAVNYYGPAGAGEAAKKLRRRTMGALEGVVGTAAQRSTLVLMGDFNCKIGLVPGRTDGGTGAEGIGGAHPDREDSAGTRLRRSAGGTYESRRMRLRPGRGRSSRIDYVITRMGQERDREGEQVGRCELWRRRARKVYGQEDTEMGLLDDGVDGQRDGPDGQGAEAAV